MNSGCLALWMMLMFFCPTHFLGENPVRQNIEQNNFKDIWIRLSSFKDMEGNKLQVNESKCKVLVLRFCSIKCPHSRIFNQLNQTLYEKYKDSVSFYDINSNYQESKLHIKEERKSQKLTVPLIIDNTSLLAKVFDIKTNTEFLVFDKDRGLLYQGYYYIKSNNQTGTNTQTIETIIIDALQNKSIPFKKTDTYGCAIDRNPIVSKEELPILLKALELRKR